MRILDHPILGKFKRPDRSVQITVDGKRLDAFQEEPIIASLLAAGIRICRYTEKRSAPRFLFCGIGRCTDCIMTVNGIPNVRTCVTLVEEGMNIQTQRGRGKWEKNP